MHRESLLDEEVPLSWLTGNVCFTQAKILLDRYSSRVSRNCDLGYCFRYSIRGGFSVDQIPTYEWRLSDSDRDADYLLTKICAARLRERM
jgi:hypothetical protein